jgi:hypothetical protein
MMNEERMFSHPEHSGSGRGGFGNGGQQFMRRGDVPSHVVYKNSKMNKKDFEKK